jgi:hypothetical protein
MYPRLLPSNPETFCQLRDSPIDESQQPVPAESLVDAEIQVENLNNI